MKPNPPAGETVYKDHRFEVRAVELPLRGGGSQRRGVLVHPGAVVILALTDADEVVFIRNRRWTLGHSLLELPAGGLEPGEALVDCARRELLEETGYQAGRIEALQSFYAAPGVSTEVMHAFIARELRLSSQRLEADEDIEVELVPLALARRWLLDGELEHGSSLAILGRFFLGLDERAQTLNNANTCSR